MAHTPHTWNNGDVISAAILNALETDLAAVPPVPTTAAQVGADPAGAATTAQAAAIAAAAAAAASASKSADTITDGTTNKAYTTTERTKLAGIATGATANRADTAVDTLLAAKADLVAGVIPTSQIPALALTNTVPVADQAAMLALTTAQVQPGDVAVRADGAGTFILTATDPTQLASWTRLNAPTDAVTTVNGQSGTVVLTAANVGADAAGAAAAITPTSLGLGNVNNTADTAKPVSTAQATAIGNTTLNLPVNVIVPAGASVRTAVIGARNSIDASTGPVTVALPTPTAVGQNIILERADTSAVTANLITITGTIRNAASTVTLAAVGAAFEGAHYISESLTSWAIAGSIKPRAVLDTFYGSLANQTRTLAATGYTGTFQGAWAGNFVYAIGDIVTAENGLFACTTAHTANAAGFRYDREKWSFVPLPILGGGSTVAVRQQNITTPGTGIATPYTAGVFQPRPKSFNRRTERVLAAHQAPADLTVTGTGSVALGTAVGGSLILSSPTNATEGQYRGAAFATAQDITNGSVKLPTNLSAATGNFLSLDFTSAAGGTDFTNSTRFQLIYGSLDLNRTGQWAWVGANTTEQDSITGTGATLSAVTGYRYAMYRSTANFTVEIGPALKFQPNQSTIAKCILWLDDGTFATHQSAIKIAAKYGLPITVAPIAANLVNGAGGLTMDMARYVQEYLGGQVAVHAYGDVDHNRVQSGTTLFEQLLDYQHFGLASGLRGVEDMAYWSTGLTGPNSTELELSVKKVARSARGGISRQTEALPPIDPWKTRAMMTNTTDTSVGTWQPYATKAINAKGLVQFVWHDMAATAPANQLTEFTTFCAWLAANSASIQVTTPQGAFDPLCV